MIDVTMTGGIATMRLNRGSANAINHEMVRRMDACLAVLRDDDAVRAVILTGNGRFFSFGLDIPEVLTYTRDALVALLRDFTAMYRRLYLLPKPIVAAIDGHATAGGCMLANACDVRLMATGKAVIGLNEVKLGIPVLASCAAILRSLVGRRNADTILTSGKFHRAAQAADLGLVDRAVTSAGLAAEAERIARSCAAAAVSVMQRGRREDVLAGIDEPEEQSIQTFADRWYAEPVQSILRRVRIRGQKR